MTKWGDWINFAVYILKHVDSISDFIEYLDINKHSDICKLWKSSMFQDEILKVSKNSFHKKPNI